MPALSAKWLFGAVGLLAFAAGTALWLAARAPSGSPRVTTTAPSIAPGALLATAFVDSRGTRRSLAQFPGKVLVLNFWATWCPPCRAEMPWLVKLGARMESQGVVFIAISEDDPPGQVPLVNEFAREVPGLERFAVLGDPELESAYGVTSLPTLFVLDRQGQLVQKFVGSADEGELVELVERLAR